MRRTLSINPTPRGFRYSVVELRGECEEFLVDEGTAYLGDLGVKGYRKRLKAMLKRYRPDVLVLPEVDVRKRGRRVKRVVEAMAEVGEMEGVETGRLPHLL